MEHELFAWMHQILAAELVWMLLVGNRGVAFAWAPNACKQMVSLGVMSWGKTSFEEGRKIEIPSVPGDIPQAMVVPARPSQTLGKVSLSLPALWCEMTGERDQVQHLLMLFSSFLASEGSADI